MGIRVRVDVGAVGGFRHPSSAEVLPIASALSTRKLLDFGV